MKNGGRGYFIRIASRIEVPIFGQFFLESNNENDNIFLHTGRTQKNELHYKLNFLISYKKKKMPINHKVMLK